MINFISKSSNQKDVIKSFEKNTKYKVIKHKIAYKERGGSYWLVILVKDKIGKFARFNITVANNRCRVMNKTQFSKAPKKL